MKRKKSPKTPPAAPATLPVLHGNVFVTFIEEARSLGNEVMARREFDTYVAEYLKQKGLLEEWSTWLSDRKLAARGIVDS